MLKQYDYIHSSGLCYRLWSFALNSVAKGRPVLLHSTLAFVKPFKRNFFTAPCRVIGIISNSSLATIHCILSNTFPFCCFINPRECIKNLFWIPSQKRMLAAKRISSHMGLQSPYTHTCMFPHVLWIKKLRKEWADSVEVTVLGCTCWS